MQADSLQPESSMEPATPEAQDVQASAALQDVTSARFFKALGDPTRLNLFIQCACTPESCGCNVSSLASCCTVDLSVVSRHLKILLDAGLVEADKQGREVFYRVPAKEVAAQLRQLADILEGVLEEGCAC